MYDYANLPSLVLRTIFTYLTVKDRIRCKVCRKWKQEVELKEANRKCLVVSVGSYEFYLNEKWLFSRKLMKIENAFEVKSLNILKHRFTAQYFKTVQKLMLINQPIYHVSIFNFQEFVHFFQQLIELEMYCVPANGKIVFNLPNLKVLAFDTCFFETLKLNCPSLEVFVCSGKAKTKIDYRKLKKLKYLECTNNQLSFDWNTKLPSLERFNFLNFTNEYDDDLLSHMPNLQQLIYYSENAEADMKAFEKQKLRFGLNRLAIHCAGFSSGTIVNLKFLEGNPVFDVDERMLDALFTNYPKMIENCRWKSRVNYGPLFDKFPILPREFLQKLGANRVFGFLIDKVNNYTHLRQFLRCMPDLKDITMILNDLEVEPFNGLLDELYLLTPQLCSLYLKLDNPALILKYDLSFLLNLKISIFKFESQRLPASLAHRALRRCRHLIRFIFEIPSSNVQFSFIVQRDGTIFFESCPLEQFKYKSIDAFVYALKTDQFFKKFVLP